MKIELSKIPTRAPKGFEKDNIFEETQKIVAEITRLQVKLYAQKKYSLLIILQGLDASGKDGLIRRLFNGVSPFGVEIKSYEKPTEEEYSYDFLWRVHQEVPAKGMIKIFNRSHYEDILVPTVEGYIPKKIIDKRYNHINAFEDLLLENDTIILKFYLHVSKEKQKERLIERLNLLRKHYKHKDSDWQTREKFDKYIAVYEEIFKKCNKIPWHIIPTDQKWYKVFLVAQKIQSTLEKLDINWPELDSKLFDKNNEKYIDYAREIG